MEEVLTQPLLQEKILSYLAIEDAVNLRVSRNLRNWPGEISVTDKNCQISKLNGVNTATVELAGVLKRLGSRNLLVYVSANNLIDLVRILIWAGASPNSPNKKCEYPLTSAIQSNHFEIVQILISAGANPNLINRDNQNPMMLALKNANLPIVQLLVQTGVSLDSEHTMSYAMLIGKSGNLSILKYSEEIGLDISIDRETGYKILNEACYSGHFDMIQYLISRNFSTPPIILFKKLISSAIHGNQLSIVRYFCERLPSFTNFLDEICLAFRMGRIDISKYFLEREDFSKYSMKNQGRLLHLAIELNQLEIVQILISKGVNIFYCDSHNRNGLMISAIYGSFEVFKFLCENFGHQFGFFSKDENGMTAATLALENCRAHQIVKFLISKGIPLLAETNFPNPYCLFFASRQNEDKIVSLTQLLIESGYNINTGPFAQKPIVLAIVNFLPSVLGLLIENGGNCNIKNEEGKTPLMIATNYGSYFIINSLINGGVNINQTDNQGETVLFQAVRLRNQGLIQLFLQRGADKNLVNSSNQTPKFLAGYLGYGEIFDLFMTQS